MIFFVVVFFSIDYHHSIAELILIKDIHVFGFLKSNWLLIIKKIGVCCRWIRRIIVSRWRCRCRWCRCLGMNGRRFSGIIISRWCCCRWRWWRCSSSSSSRIIRWI